jgi:hypothetical protein
LLSVDDIKQENKELNRQAAALRAEILSLRSKLVYPPEFKGLISGAGLGYMFGALPGALIGAIAGYKVGDMNKQRPEDQQIIKNLIIQKEGQLRALIDTKDIYKQAAGGVMSADKLAKMDYDAYDFDGEFYDLFGKPAHPFHCMVFGRPKQGKSIFSFQFAAYLSQFGKVLYIASEEGFGGTLQKKIKDFGLENNQFVNFSNAKGMEEMRKVIPNHDFVFIDSVNYSRLEVEDVEQLKREFPKTSFITIQQATKGGQFRGSQEYAHNCDMIVEVVSGVAHQIGRFQAASEYQIFKQPEQSADDKKQAEPEQLSLFDI